MIVDHLSRIAFFVIEVNMPSMKNAISSNIGELGFGLKSRYRDKSVRELNIDVKVEVNFIKFCSEVIMEHFVLLTLRYSTLSSFHRVLHERDSMNRNKVVT